MGRKCRHDLRIKRQWGEWKTNSVFDYKRSEYNLLCPMTFVFFLFQTIDAEYVKWASPARTYVHFKAFTVNVNKCLKLFFLEQHINIVNRVTLQSFWFICNCLSYTQIKDSSNKHLPFAYTINQTHYSPILTTEGSKVRRVYLIVHDMEIRINPSTSYPLYFDSTGNRKLLQSDLSFTCY